MTENDRPRRPASSSGSNPRGGRPSRPGGTGRPARSSGGTGGSGRPERPGRGERSDRPERPGRPERSDRSQRSDRPQRSDRSDRPDRTDRPRRDGPRPDRGKPTGGQRTGRPGENSVRRSGGPRDRDQRAPLDEAPRHDDPPVDEDALPGELDRAAWRELKALTKENAEWVAGHLVMASRVVDEDPERAHKHALAAARRAGRIPVVRETVGITAYLQGDFALALRELRTYRRLSGSNDQLPLMVDCERGLGRPDRALELASEVPRSSLDVAVQVELAIARSGARLDMGKPDLALTELEIPQLNPDVAYSFSPALFDSYAVVLAELGREEEAAAWGEHANRAAEALAEASGGEDDEEVTVVEMPEENPA